ncbi:MAG: hypothetical protein IKB02_05400 [Clostridia bacterium]|nr:hypothetical protein [Clostridia bacterium]
MEILIILTVGTLNIACFFIGAKVGQTVAKGEKIEAPSLNPMKAVKEHQAKKQAEAEQERIDTIMRNIESYDGTSRGQEDVPRG